MATVVLGSQWGDEGKGKLVDILCEDIEVCARCAGGNNAGHTIVANGVSYDFHILPSGQLSILSMLRSRPNCYPHRGRFSERAGRLFVPIGRLLIDIPN
jgi:adenylosuccinate synthase